MRETKPGAELEAQFDQLQRKLVPLWKSIQSFNQDPQTIVPNIIYFYLDLLPGVIPSHARPRLFLPSPLDGSVRPLSQKLLERPRLIERIRSLIPDPDRAHLVPFNTTNREKELALRLGIPMYGADPKFFVLGTK